LSIRPGPPTWQPCIRVVIDDGHGGKDVV
jgi:N-acetylmuramoyl-L-alanine amidase